MPANNANLDTQSLTEKDTTDRKNNKSKNRNRSKINSSGKGPSPKEKRSNLTESFLSDTSHSLSEVIRTTEMAPLTSGYMSLVHASWLQILKLYPNVLQEMSFNMWMHIHKLFFARRIENVVFKALGRRPHAANRAPLPSDTRVFQPIWDALIAIGVYHDVQTSAKYVPTHILPNSTDPATWSSEYIEGLAQSTAFDWEESWSAASVDLEKILSAHNKGNSYDSDVSLNDDDDPVLTKEQATQVLRDWWEYERYSRDLVKRDASFTIENGILKQSPVASSSTDTEPKPSLSKLKSFVSKHKGKVKLPPSNQELTLDDLVINPPASSKADALRAIRDHKTKAHRFTPAPAASIPAIRFDVEVDAEVGAYGRHLGWSPALWLQYQRVVEILQNNAIFSLSFPNDIEGSPAWILQVKVVNGQYFCKLPTRLIPATDSILAILVNYASWDATNRSQYHSNWYTESDRIGSRDPLLMAWILKGFKSPIGHLPVYT